MLRNALALRLALILCGARAALAIVAGELPWGPS